MDKDVNDILQAMREWCDLGINLAQLSSADFYDRVALPLEDHTEYRFEWHVGASKGVMVFEELDLVIKVPFQATEYDEGEYQNSVEAWAAGELDEEPQLEDYIHDLYRATNFFIETAHDWDYCDLECGIYEEAVKVGLEAYFAKSEYIGEVNGYPIYRQELVCPFDHDRQSHSRSEEDRQRASKTCDRLEVTCFNACWIADFLDCYGEDEFKKLGDFLNKLDIRDLHSGNIGYMGAYPVLLDYSDYND